MKLARAFGVRRGDVVAFVGAGGKTATLLALGHELADIGWRVLATTTTRLGRDQLPLFPAALTSTSRAEIISQRLTRHGFLFLYGDIVGDKVTAPPSAYLAGLIDSVDADVMLVEADGARGLPLKAPRAYEPAMPADASLVIPVASLQALGRPLDEDHVLNAAAITEHFGFSEGARIKSPWVAQVLRDREFGLKRVPERARAVAWINAVPEMGYARGRARLIAQLCLREPGLEAAAFGSARASDPAHEVHRRVAAVVLAAGSSQRMGEMKVLLPWKGDAPILEHILLQLFTARVDPIVVVTGHRAADVRSVARRLEVQTAHNPDYAAGEMLSSLKTGLLALGDDISAALIVLGDQPQIQPRVIHQVLEAYARGEGDIVAPSFERRRGHPILISRRFWPELLALPAGAAPRDVINRYAELTAFVTTQDDSILRDVDTPEAYRRERRAAGFES